ncbi:uncharacterized protein LOC131949970 isoform X2 [Physella acuta]|nr:uncharacterized protein LOC131949970 isoform X2 [Physella acuta]XP_059167946.1 uncharacterized protein LOC131949970 isoform X2 [Physella acuta]
MSLSLRSQKHLNQMIESLQEQQAELQDLLIHYVQQISKTACDWITAVDKSYLTFEEVHSVVSAGSRKLLGLINCLTEATRKDEELNVVDLAPVKKMSVDSCEKAESYKKIISRLEALEDNVSSLRDTTQQLQDEEKETKLWKNEIVTWQGQTENKLEELDGDQRGRTKNCIKKIKDLGAKLTDVQLEVREILIREQKDSKKLESVCKAIASTEQDLAQLHTKVISLNDSSETTREEMNSMCTALANTEEELTQVSTKVVSLTELTEVTREEIKHMYSAVGKLEVESKQTKTTFEEQLNKVDSKNSVLCRLFLHKLLPIEKLFPAINKAVISTKFNNNQLSLLQKDLTNLTQELHTLQLKPKQEGVFIGFTASFYEVCKFLHNTIIKGYNCIFCNVGNGFNPELGVFTAPVDGLYVAHFSFKQINSGSLYLEMVHSSPVCENEVSYMKTERNDSADGCSTVVVMKTDDRLFVKLKYAAGKALLSNCSQFSCFLANV